MSTTSPINSIQDAADQHERPFPFFRLPRELRNLACDAMLSQGSAILSGQCDLDLNLQNVPPAKLERVNHQFRRELLEQCSGRNASLIIVDWRQHGPQSNALNFGPSLTFLSFVDLHLAISCRAQGTLHDRSVCKVIPELDLHHTKVLQPLALQLNTGSITLNIYLRPHKCLENCEWNLENYFWYSRPLSEIMHAWWQSKVLKSFKIYRCNFGYAEWDFSRKKILSMELSMEKFELKSVL